ncbi:Outer membrane protein TolC [Hydrobacter penzbergensis]|uniref:Outer membrane protein TolC n=1 Tax=Hydrobacter penzbergensis TaxID=1235997 RepID=A0A8X8IIK7_9BACT|nr:TolC family protein [Hydrobacter penzbergensis]SDX62610.1 Outer membrane protein TolC [Hydrobacter penzbergensis]
MQRITKYILAAAMAFPLFSYAQQAPVLTLDSILQRIDKQNVRLQSYALKAQAYQSSAEAATAWTAPMVGAGTFMTPYPLQSVMESRDKGQLMLRVEQDIPNAAKLKAKKEYIASQGAIASAGRDITLNDFRARAKSLYYTWLVNIEKIKVAGETERLILVMKKMEEVRYPYNQSQLSSIFKADARIEENRNMIKMYESEIAKSRAWLNGLMNQTGDYMFSIDTAAIPEYKEQLHDTALLAGKRKDIVQMDAAINSLKLNIRSMELEKRPNFKIQFDHMSPLAGMMPQAFSVMGMVSIPIVPWSSKMYKQETRAIQYNVASMQKEREAMLNETHSMLIGMQYEIIATQQRISNFENRIIPALQKVFDADFQSYEENKQTVTTVLSDWESLIMMRMNVLDEKLKLYQMIVSHEKEEYQ